MDLRKFITPNMFLSLKDLFEQLNIPVNYIAEEPVNPQEILKNTFRPNNMAFGLMNQIYFLGMVDDGAFDGNESLDYKKIKSDYDGILIFGVTLNKRADGLLPTRTYIADITRAFNREFHYTPVVVVFQYKDANDEQYITFASAERLPYKQEWREGEKAGKVSMLKDISIRQPHRGHVDILKELQIKRSGKNAVNSFDGLYKYWQEVFNVSVLNKKFYKELSHWYFWALNEDKGKLKFPNQPLKSAFASVDKYQEAVKTHKGKNVIRLLTRVLFVWFIKEKGLIPEELFDPKYLKDNILKELAPEHDEGTLFALEDLNSYYYKGILQNLFFATLNQEMGKRAFRRDGQNQGVTNLMRYQDFFKDTDRFIELMEKVVPFMNGGLFECLDKDPVKDNSHLIDGFSERKANDLQVPDFLFFDSHEVLDLSADYGSKNKAYKNAETKGLIRILESYKFTITENTPIEQEIALDPELLGKVFENLLASYNPETKSTARKQTGSFYTPREIVNYMVDESLIAYLKTGLLGEEASETEQTKLDEQLHQLFSYESTNPFKEDDDFSKKIIDALDHCKILDPACGSGAFPMGVLHKMVHVLDKLDPKNEKWKQRQISKANLIEDASIRDEAIENIEEAFENNEMDYGRKLFLIENCIYGVDIQPVATQISKLRFFISLIVDQKVDKSKENFGIRPLPNLETKFVSANTLVGISKEIDFGNTEEVEALEKQLKTNRQNIFSAKTPRTKRKYRELDQQLREAIAQKLESYGMDQNTAQQLASWNPFDQNASADFFDIEWMFGMKEGFDVVIGNPPYIKEYTDKKAFEPIKGKKYYQGKMDIWYYFACDGIDKLKEKGTLCFIATNNWITNAGASIMRNKIVNDSKILKLIDFGSYMIFESADIQTMILLVNKQKKSEYLLDHRVINENHAKFEDVVYLLDKQKKKNNSIQEISFSPSDWLDKPLIFKDKKTNAILNLIQKAGNFFFDKKKEVATGIDVHQDFLNKKGAALLNDRFHIGEGIFNLSTEEKNQLGLSSKENELIRPFYTSQELMKYYGSDSNEYWVIYTDSSFKNEENIGPYPNIKKHLDKFQPVITSDNKPYGLHRARNEYFFKGEKIISLRKCSEPTFTYTNFDCYVSQTFFVIKTDRINQRYLTGVLNSSVVKYWLRHKGKMQPPNFQVDKGPILTIPIRHDKMFENVIEILVSILIKVQELKLIGQFIEIEIILHSLVFNLYFFEHMREEKINIIGFVEQDLEEILKGKDFEKMSDTEKEDIIEELYQKWTHPDNEVRNRIKLFAVRSPDILKPILESK